MAKKRKKAADAPAATVPPLSVRTSLIMSAIAALVYYYSNPRPQVFYDYTFRVAGNLLEGKIAFTQPQPTWLNEFVPFEGFYYSVFPLGAVVSMLPFAAVRSLGIIREMPGACVAALIAGVSCFLLLRIASRYEIGNSKRILLALAVLFGTFAWTNLTFDGAWQLALGFAMLGEIGAIWFTVFDRRPLIAGTFFALSFGNRTEVLLTAPVFFYLLNRTDAKVLMERQRDLWKTGSWFSQRLGAAALKSIAWFCLVPFVLGTATLAYNYIRFHSFSDFGYARIPGVLDEPWYNHGIFSPYYIPRQAWEMLLKLWEWKDTFPYLVPNGFSGSVLLSSPFLVLLLRFGARDTVLKYASWIALGILTILLWMHGNSGGWQFAYRYWMVALPWVFVILLESSPKKITPVEWVLYSLSFLANAYATWLFHWTEYIKP